MGKLRLVHVDAGQYIARAGDVGDSMYFISKGSVQVCVLMPITCPKYFISTGSVQVCVGAWVWVWVCVSVSVCACLLRPQTLKSVSFPLPYPLSRISSLFLPEPLHVSFSCTRCVTLKP